MLGPQAARVRRQRRLVNALVALSALQPSQSSRALRGQRGRSSAVRGSIVMMHSLRELLLHNEWLAASLRLLAAQQRSVQNVLVAYWVARSAQTARQLVRSGAVICNWVRVEAAAQQLLVGTVVVALRARTLSATQRSATVSALWLAAGSLLRTAMAARGAGRGAQSEPLAAHVVAACSPVLAVSVGYTCQHVIVAWSSGIEQLLALLSEARTLLK